MWDRYDPRDDDRDRGNGWDRSLGGRGSATDRNRNDERDSRDVFTKDLDLPRGRERQPVRERDRVYEIDGAESRALATIGAFRVVAESGLQDIRDDSQSSRRSLKHLENEGLIRTSSLSSEDRAVTLTDRGRDLLEANRYERADRSHEPRQTFYAGLRKPRELTHDTGVYRAYQRAEERLCGQGGRVRRVVLDYELKRDYQRFLHERNRGKKDCDSTITRKLDRTDGSTTDDRLGRQGLLSPEFYDRGGDHETRRGCGNDAAMEITNRFPQPLGNLAPNARFPHSHKPIPFPLLGEERRMNRPQTGSLSERRTGLLSERRLQF